MTNDRLDPQLGRLVQGQAENLSPEAFFDALRISTEELKEANEKLRRTLEK